jgi:Glycosyl hydrolases family 38 N-terminal domain./Glycosyl hydrolases family 38 C-terminal domain.
MRKRIICYTTILFFFICSGQGKAQAFLPVWQIGKNDKSAQEFALYHSNHNDYLSGYKDGIVLYEIGKSKESDIPYFIPGIHDAWAGSRAGQMIIRFGIGQLDTNSTARLRINLVEAHPSASPLLQINLNDFEVKVKTPAGKNQNFLSDKKTTSENLFVEIDIPKGTLQKGDNVLIIRNASGSWLALDNMVFSADKSVTLAKASGKVALLSSEFIPVLKYGKDEELVHPVVLQIANWTDKLQDVDVKIDNLSLKKTRLHKGMNTIEVFIPETTTEKEVSIQLLSGAEVAGKREIRISPVKKWTVYLVQHTHTDIGYTKPQTEILPEHLRYIDYAIEYCELSSSMPEDAKFRWTCEAAWAVEEYLKIRPQEQIDKLKKYINNGQIEVTAMFFNMSEIVDENSLKTFLDPFHEFKKHNIPVKTAMQNDVNGIAWCLADYLPDLGVKYVWMGEHGHRALIPFDKPTVFRWESPSGKPITTYRADHYMTANFWGINHGDVEHMRPNLLNYLTNLEDRNYPFDAVGVQYSGYYTDNSPPSLIGSNLIKEWNETYAYPKLKSSLASDFMDYISANYPEKLEPFRVAYPDWWTDGFGSAARETAASRKTHSDMITVQGLLSIASLKGKDLPAHIQNQIRHIHENLLFYDEHTFGASESIRDPMCENSQVQWAEKSAYAWEALKKAQMLYETSAGLLQNDLPRGKNPTITFFNTLNWIRSEVMTMYIDYEVIPRGKLFRIVDKQGNALKVQPVRSRTEGIYYAIYAENIPAMGYKTYEIVIEDKPAVERVRTSLTNNIIENDYYKIKINPSKGSIESLFDKELSSEMVDTGSPWQLGAFVYEKLDNRRQMEQYTLTDYDRFGISEVEVTGVTNGPIYQSITIQGKSGCCEDGFGVKMEIRLFHHTKRIELAYAIKRLPETDPTGIYVAFPFKLDDATLSFDVQGGLLISGENQLTGTASDWNTVQSFVRAKNDRVQFIVGSDLVPLFEMGGITTGQYQYRKSYEKPYVYSWVMNNYWTTNFRAYQQGEFRWSYYLTSTDDTSIAKAATFGWSSRVPLYARVMPAGKENNQPAEYSAFSFNQENFLMTSSTPSKEKDYVLLNVRELNGKESILKIIDGNGNPVSFSIVNVIEEVIEDGSTETRFIPYENKFIKIKL